MVEATATNMVSEGTRWFKNAALLISQVRGREVRQHYWDGSIFIQARNP